MAWVYDDGGRAKAGFKGRANDCVVRAISIALEKPYELVYNELNTDIKESRQTKTAKISNSRKGIHRRFYDAYLKRNGWKWIPVMQIGSGCKMHLRAEELPHGRIIARCSRHLVAVIDGIIHDTYDSSRNGNRCVYGYYIKR